MAAVLLMLGTAGLAVPLASSESLGFSSRQTNAWIVALYGISGVLCVAFALVFRQPALIGFNNTLLAFFGTLTGDVGYSDLAGATFVGGATVLLLAALGWTNRVAGLVPRPVIFGVLAGSILPFVAGIFDAFGDERLLVGGAVVAYVLSRRFFSVRFPAILPALVVGLILAVVTDRFGELPTSWTAPALDGARPTFSLATIVTVVPVFVVMVTLIGNASGIAYLRSQGYAPPVRTISMASGAAAMVGAFFGPTAICQMSILTPLAAGPETGGREGRHWAVSGAGTGWVLTALAAGIAVDVLRAIPLPLLLAVAGLALLGVLADALGEVTRGPLRVGPLVAFAVSSSQLSIAGLGPLFWALVLGTVFSVVLERDALVAVPANER